LTTFQRVRVAVDRYAMTILIVNTVCGDRSRTGDHDDEEDDVIMIIDLVGTCIAAFNLQANPVIKVHAAAHDNAGSQT
jgi:hypothetical protein